MITLHPELQHPDFNNAGIRYDIVSMPREIEEDSGAVMQAIAAQGDLSLLEQVHGDRVLFLETPPEEGHPLPEADAQITMLPGLYLGVMTADCVPILLVDPTIPMIGAVHSGWRGTAAAIAEKTVASMCANGALAHRIRAYIGPAIQSASYEVSDDVYQAFHSADADYGSFFTATKPRKWHADLPGCVAYQLRKAGVRHIVDSGVDTYHSLGRLYSYRRYHHEARGERGTNLAVIGIVS